MTQQLDPCERANRALMQSLNKAVDAVEEGNSQAFDQALENMVKIRKGMELGDCSLKKPMGFERR